MKEVELRSVLSANIKRYRARMALTQAKLAEKLDISNNFLSDIETGKGWVSPFTLVKLADALNVEVYELFKPEEPISSRDNELISKFISDISFVLNESVNQALNNSLDIVSRQYVQKQNDDKISRI